MKRWLGGRQKTVFVVAFGAAAVAAAIVVGVRCGLFSGGFYRISDSANAPSLLGDHILLVCPNCGLEHAVGAPKSLRGRGPSRPGGGRVRCPACRTSAVLSGEEERGEGDRIYIALSTSRSRWQLVAYRSPRSPGPRDGMSVKRLIGLPGDTVELAGGEVWVDGKLLGKPPELDSELWHLVADSELRPKSPMAASPGWVVAPGSGWSASGASFEHRGATDAEERLELSGTIDDSFSYNSLYPPGGAPSPVGDVRVVATATDIAAEGWLAVEWRRAGRIARATLDAAGRTSLRLDDREVGSSPGTAPHGDVALGLVVRDGCVRVLRDGAAVVTSPLPGAERLYREAEREPCSLALVAGRSRLRVLRIVVERDVRYGPASGPPRQGPNSGAPVRLGGQEYYLLGDNPPVSADSRYFGPIRGESILGSVVPAPDLLPFGNARPRL